MKSWLTVLCVLIVIAAGGWPVEAQNPQGQAPPPPPPPSVLDKVADDLYVLRGEGGNTTIYLTDEGVILVDVKFERNYDEIVAKVRSLTDKPIRYVFNSHSHGDHTGSNQKLIGTATIIGHQNVRSAMIQGKQAGPPQVTYRDELTITLGGKEVVARYFGRAHTNGDTWVYFPAHKVVATGDSFNTGNGRGETGSILKGFLIAPGGSIMDITKTLEGVLKWDFNVAIPGHGPIGKRADVVNWQTEIGKVQSRLSASLRQGGTKADVEKILVESGSDANVAARMIDSLMAELKP